MAIEAVKRAEDTDDVIVRLYEADGGDANVKVHCGFAVAAAAEVDLMEANPRQLTLRDGKVALTFTPFEIKTLRLTRQ